MICLLQDDSSDEDGEPGEGGVVHHHHDDLPEHAAIPGPLLCRGGPRGHHR